MSLDKALQGLKFDVRMQEFNLNNGVISQADLKGHLSQLPDSSGQAEKMEIEENQNGSQQH